MSVSDCEGKLRLVRSELIECNVRIDALEQLDATKDVLGELANLKFAKNQMEENIQKMWRAIECMKIRPDKISDIVNDNTALWAGTIVQ